MQDTPTDTITTMTDTTHSPSINRDAIKKIVHEEVVLNAGYINGEWITIERAEHSNQNSQHALYDPSMADVIATTWLCDKSHVDKAARAAATAFTTWSQTSVSERADYLEAIANVMQAKFNTLVGLSVLNNGKPID